MTDPPMTDRSILTLRCCLGPAPWTGSLPPYPPRGELSLDESGIVWRHRPRGRWNLNRWGERRPPAEHDLVEIEWAAISEMKLTFVQFEQPRSRNLSIRVRGRSDSPHVFGGLRYRPFLELASQLGFEFEQLNRHDYRWDEHQSGSLQHG